MDYRRPHKCLRDGPQTEAESPPLVHTLAVVLLALAVGAVLYAAALNGKFVFDDETLPFRRGIQNEPLTAWIHGVRPFLMLTYWLNYVLSGQETYGYHALNLLLHALNTGLVF